jgi:hypothetical protein
MRLLADPYCVRITTGTGSGDGGVVNVWVDEGSGFASATTTDYEYSKGETVLSQCYVSFVALQIENPTTGRWQGSILYSADGGSFSAMQCTAGCVSTGSLTDNIDCDGNNDGSSTGTSQCLDAICTVKPVGGVQVTCSCPNGTPAVASGSDGTVCEGDGDVDCSACDAGYTISDTAASGSLQTCDGE